MGVKLDSGGCAHGCAVCGYRCVVVELIVEVWLRSSTAMGVWSMWTLAHTGVNGDPIVKDVVTRVKYFYVVTLVLNVRGTPFFRLSH